MFGIYFKSICPNCGQMHNVSLGACTAYYTVNDSKLEYTSYDCPVCDKSYWLSHDFNGLVDTKKKDETDKVKATGVACW